jgi:FixJ family two-component response regulator
MSTQAAERTVHVVDDDYAVRDSLSMLFRKAGLAVRAYSSALEFLGQPLPPLPACLVLDIRMPGMSGTELHDLLTGRGSTLPVVFITGHGDIPTAVEAVKKGAYDFIEKPFDDYQLLSQVLGALEYPQPQAGAALPPVSLEQLSGREQQVLQQVLAGKPSRQVADELHISVRTVEFHRARIMQKLGVRSTAELFRLCLRPVKA